ncbi:hypothetical protein C1645_814590 [Glomus cerebriforme]|uniref:Uncharacterized protein n=1 Tax=Glomus cerebriforme TaxID=658196 RepID=A0A397TFM5_9GLOM|nr:hypothetical protein C1645_814590 [Glomus cerebriforme]
MSQFDIAPDSPTNSVISQEENSREQIFDHWNHAYLVLLVYGKQIGFIWQVQDKYLDKHGGVYKYIFECQHARTFKSKKIATNPLQQYLANAIQYFHKGDITDPKQDSENNASNLLEELQKMKEDDPT